MDQEQSKPTRRSVLKRIGLAGFGFIVTGTALLRGEPVMAAACTKVYCRLRGNQGAQCSWSCYDTYTLQYCYSFVAPC